MGVSVDRPSRGPYRRHVRLYSLAFVVSVVSFGYFLIGVYEMLSGMVLFALLVLTAAFAALTVVFDGDFISSVLLGLLPAAAVALSQAFVRQPTSTGPSLVHDSWNVVLISSSYALPIATVGFVTGAVWRYRGDLLEKARWILIRVVIAATATAILFAAQSYSVIRFGGVT